MQPDAKRVLAGVIALVIIIGFVVLLGALTREKEELPAEQEIAQVLAGAQQVIARGDVDVLVKLISDDYNDGYGNSGPELQGRLRRSCADLAGWGVTYSNVLIMRDEASDNMLVELDVAASNEKDPQNMRWNGHVSLSFKQEGRQWRVVDSSGWQGDLVL